MGADVFQISSVGGLVLILLGAALLVFAMANWKTDASLSKKRRRGEVKTLPIPERTASDPSHQNRPEPLGSASSKTLEAKATEEHKEAEMSNPKRSLERALN